MTEVKARPTRLTWCQSGLPLDNPRHDNCPIVQDAWWTDGLAALCNCPCHATPILQALKVQQAAETGVRADERREMQKAVAEAMAWSEHHRLQHGGCEWAVKGEQP